MYRSQEFGDNHVRYEVREKQSFLSRVKTSVFSILGGLILVALAIGILAWNEGRAVTTRESLEEGSNQVISLGNGEIAFKENDGRLVHITGKIRTNKPLADLDFGVSLEAVKLKRRVWMFQWFEEKTERSVDRGDHHEVETTYSYWSDWKEELISSRTFDRPHKHENPRSFRIDGKTITAQQTYIGNFVLTSSLVSKISNYISLPLHPDSISPSIKDNKNDHTVMDNTIYISSNTNNPQIGDLKIKYEYAGSTSSDMADFVTVVSGQRGNTFVPFKTTAGDILEFLYMEELSPKEVFSKENDQNEILTWALRGGGWVLMIIGFILITDIISTLVSWIPIVNTLVSLGTFALSLALSTSISGVVIALAWLRYRPLFTAGILLVAATPTIIAWLVGRRERSMRGEKRH